MNKLNGTIFVYNPEDKKQAEELNLWYNNFVEKPNLSEKCCLLVGSRKMNDDDQGRIGSDAKLCKKMNFFFQLNSYSLFWVLATLFSDIPRLSFNGKADEIETIKQTFVDYLKKVITETSRSHDQENRFS